MGKMTALIAAEVEYHSSKNNFVYVHSNRENGASFNPVPVYLRVETQDKRRFYVSGYAEHFFVGRTSQIYYIKMNALFCAKHGIKIEEKVTLKVLKNVQKCLEVKVELLSVDDWEIAESNTEQIEKQLLNQLHVVYKDLTFILWIDNSVCVFFKVESIKPDVECVRLETGSKILIAPKFADRSDQLLKSLTNNSHKNVDNDEKISQKFESKCHLYEKSLETTNYQRLLNELLTYCQSNLLDFDAFCGHVIVEGAPSSGSTHLAENLQRFLSLSCNIRSKFVDCKTLYGKSLESVSKSFGQLFDYCFKNQPSILILDDLDHLCSSPNSAKQLTPGAEMHFTRCAKVLQKFLDCIFADRIRCICVCTCKSKQKLHDTLIQPRGKRYFTKCVQIPSLNENDRRDVLIYLLTYKGVKCGDNDKNLVQKLVKTTEGCVAGDINRLIDRILLAKHRRGSSSDYIDQTDLEFALTDFKPLSVHGAKVKESTSKFAWQDVGGLRDVKHSLKRVLLWPSKYSKLYESLNIRLAAGVLLYGPSGTGKTFLATVAAKECKLNCIVVKGAELLSKYIGASEQAVRDTFLRARAVKPSVILFDEFDALAPRRGHDSTGVTDRVVNQLLTELDGVEPLDGVYILATTSRPDLIDQAFLRPGRIDKFLYCNLPTLQERIDILQCICKHMTVDQNLDFERISRFTDRFSGADLKSLLYGAQMNALHESAANSFTTALNGKSRLLDDATGKCGKNSTVSRRATFYAYFPSLNEKPVHNYRLETKNSGENKGFDFRDDSALYSQFGELTNALKEGQKVTVNMSNVISALNDARPSVSESELKRFEILSRKFGASLSADAGDSGKNLSISEIGSRATLA